MLVSFLLCCCGLGHYTTRKQLFTGTENNAPSSIETMDAEGSQKRQCTSENLEEKSIENKRNIKRQYIPKVKKEFDLPRRSSKRLEELKLKTVVNCVLSEQAHGAATGKSGETEVKPLQTISTQITDHDLRGTKLSDINEKALEDQVVPEDQPARPETEMKDQENLGSEVNPSRDSWSDPCLEFAFKTLTGALVVENNSDRNMSCHGGEAEVDLGSEYGASGEAGLGEEDGGELNEPARLAGDAVDDGDYSDDSVMGFVAANGRLFPEQVNTSRCCRMWSKIEKWIATLEFDRDRKSMGVMVSSSSGRKLLLVKTRNAIELVVSAIAAGLGALTHTLGTLVPVIGANGFATATAATTTAIGTIVGSFR
ncbi:unnamed protein product [Camellia sinensis]